MEIHVYDSIAYTVLPEQKEMYFFTPYLIMARLKSVATDWYFYWRQNQIAKNFPFYLYLLKIFHLISQVTLEAKETWIFGRSVGVRCTRTKKRCRLKLSYPINLVGNVVLKKMQGKKCNAHSQAVRPFFINLDISLRIELRTNTDNKNSIF